MNWRADLRTMAQLADPSGFRREWPGRETSSNDGSSKWRLRMLRHQRLQPIGLTEDAAKRRRTHDPTTLQTTTIHVSHANAGISTRRSRYGNSGDRTLEAA